MVYLKLHANFFDQQAYPNYITFYLKFHKWDLSLLRTYLNNIALVGKVISNTWSLGVKQFWILVIVDFLIQLLDIERLLICLVFFYVFHRRKVIFSLGLNSDILCLNYHHQLHKYRLMFCLAHCLWRYYFNT